jgi:RNAse (barnase) inhibitor barstar
MRIITFKPEDYKGHPVYYRNFKDHFEYFTIVRGELYTAHITVKPTLINMILCWIGIEKTNYSVQQQGKILKILRRLAETTVDFKNNKK